MIDVHVTESSVRGHTCKDLKKDNKMSIIINHGYLDKDPSCRLNDEN